MSGQPQADITSATVFLPSGEIYFERNEILAVGPGILIVKGKKPEERVQWCAPFRVTMEPSSVLAVSPRLV